MTITRIALADDHPIVLEGLRNLITAEPDFVVVGEALDGLTALTVIREQQPDIAVIDLTMPQLNGIALTKRLAVECPAVRVLLLTLHEDRAYVQRALEVGVRGYALKRTAAENLVPAIRAVQAGGHYLDPVLADRIVRRSNGRPQVERPITIDLTERECDVLRLSASGLTGKEIARQLDISIKSVETYKSRGTEKLGLKTRAELVRYAAIQGWIGQG
jgi:DNA-binding NarL/FixJ family response regulator